LGRVVGTDTGERRVLLDRARKIRGHWETIVAGFGSGGERPPRSTVERWEGRVGRDEELPQ